MISPTLCFLWFVLVALPPLLLILLVEPAVVSLVCPCCAASATAHSSCRASCRDLQAQFIRYWSCISCNARSACCSVANSMKANVLFISIMAIMPWSPLYFRKALSNSACLKSTSDCIEIWCKPLIKSFSVTTNYYELCSSQNISRHTQFLFANIPDARN